METTVCISPQNKVECVLKQVKLQDSRSKFSQKGEYEPENTNNSAMKSWFSNTYLLTTPSLFLPSPSTQINIILH